MTTLAELPIEQSARHASARFQGGFVREAQQLLRATDVVTIAAAEGLVVRAPNEAALHRALQALRDRHGEELVVSPPQVRYVFQRGRWYEPVMSLRVSAALRYLPAVREDLLARGVEQLEEYKRSRRGVLRAQVPLQDILGYYEHLSRLTEGSGSYWIWLDRYRPMRWSPPGGGDAA